MNTATVAVEQKEEAMKVLSIAELLCLTRMELLEIRRSLELEVDELPWDCIELREAEATLANIRLVLARPELQRLAPGS